MKLPILPAIVLTAIVATGAWGGYKYFVLPLEMRDAELADQTAVMRERTAGARRTIREIQAKENAAAAASIELGRLEKRLPAGAAMVWLPELLKTHFGGFGIAVPLVRFNTTQDEPELPGYSRGFWSVALPIDAAGQNIPKLLLAVTELEQQNSFVNLLDFAVRPDPEHPSGRVASINVSVLFRK